MHVPTDVNVSTVSEPAVDDVGVHAAAFATSANESVNALTDETDSVATAIQRRDPEGALMAEV